MSAGTLVCEASEWKRPRGHLGMSVEVAGQDWSLECGGVEGMAQTRVR